MSSEEKSKEEPQSTNDRTSQSSAQNRSKTSRRSKESYKSLSTITEEPKSTASTKSSMKSFTSSIKTVSPARSKEKIVIAQPEEKKEKPAPNSLPTTHNTKALPFLRMQVLQEMLKTPIEVREGGNSRSSSWQQRLLAHVQMGGKPLFPTVMGEELTGSPSMLVTGFGLRNLASLQEALHIEDHLKLKEIYKAYERRGEGSITSIGSSSGATSTLPARTESTSETQTDITSKAAAATKVEEQMGYTVCHHKQQLAYLMGTMREEDEEGAREYSFKVDQGMIPGDSEVKPYYSESMKQAQKYLRVHHIFEFFQFIIAHMLSDLPEDPIDFIISLMDKCLIFRSGLLEPPLLYTRKHLEVLFYLMDKMRTGFIDVEQYKTGLRTVGVCLYNENPPLTEDGMVSKDTFIEEAYDCLTHLLNDMVRRHSVPAGPPLAPPPPPATPQLSSLISSGAREYESVHFATKNIILDALV